MIMLSNNIKYYASYLLFKLFEIFLFLFPAFPPTFALRILVLTIYVISHILGVQTEYKKYKEVTLNNLRLQMHESIKEYIQEPTNDSKETPIEKKIFEME